MFNGHSRVEHVSCHVFMFSKIQTFMMTWHIVLLENECSNAIVVLHLHFNFVYVKTCFSMCSFCFSNIIWSTFMLTKERNWMLIFYIWCIVYLFLHCTVQQNNKTGGWTLKYTERKPAPKDVRKPIGLTSPPSSTH